MPPAVIHYGPSEIVGLKHFVHQYIDPQFKSLRCQEELTILILPPKCMQAARKARTETNSPKCILEMNERLVMWN